jgi:hypothetical protein
VEGLGVSGGAGIVFDLGHQRPPIKFTQEQIFSLVGQWRVQAGDLPVNQREISRTK